MRRHRRGLSFLILLAWLNGVALADTDSAPFKFEHIKSVFVIPMKERLDHFLTNEIVKWGRFEVTLNPLEADALLTDTLDVNIQELLSASAKIRRTMSKTRGTAFLVDLKTEKVLWSAAKKPSGPFFLGGDKSTRELAHEIVGQLKKDVLKK